jgi:hypothetical protein
MVMKIILKILNWIIWVIIMKLKIVILR